MNFVRSMLGFIGLVAALALIVPWLLYGSMHFFDWLSEYGQWVKGVVR